MKRRVLKEPTNMFDFKQVSSSRFTDTRLLNEPQNLAEADTLTISRVSWELTDTVLMCRHHLTSCLSCHQSVCHTEVPCWDCGTGTTTGTVQIHLTDFTFTPNRPQGSSHDLKAVRPLQTGLISAPAPQTVPHPEEAAGPTFICLCASCGNQPSNS